VGACGIDRGIERAYAGAVTAVTGGWLAATIAVGPATKPLPAIARIATVLLGIPWWFHRRRRAKARVEKTISAWSEVAGSGPALPEARPVQVAGT
jgi:S-DNA-T family DNA segregation ATPase FtsK/SpoIIIE